MIPKFRAWDNKRKLMIDEVVVIDLYHEYIGYLYPSEIVQGEIVSRLPINDVIIMQSTGLQDKNGKDIFEGDIVAFEDSDGGYEYQDVVINTGIVEYGELGFYFTNRVAVEMDDFYIKDGRCDDVEVIGNIYEDPELLEVEE